MAGPNRTRRPLNVTLDDDTVSILTRLSEELGLPKARVLEMGVRALEQGGAVNRAAVDQKQSAWPHGTVHLGAKRDGRRAFVLALPEG